MTKTFETILEETLQRARENALEGLKHAAAVAIVKEVFESEEYRTELARLVKIGTEAVRASFKRESGASRDEEVKP